MEKLILITKGRLHTNGWQEANVGRVFKKLPDDKNWPIDYVVDGEGNRWVKKDDAVEVTLSFVGGYLSAISGMPEIVASTDPSLIADGVLELKGWPEEEKVGVVYCDRKNVVNGKVDVNKTWIGKQDLSDVKTTLITPTIDNTKNVVERHRR